MSENTDSNGKAAPVPAPVASTDASKEADALANLTAELEGWKTKYLYLQAELDNLRKRVARERLDLLKNANEDLLRTLLPVFDNLRFAVKALKDSEAKLDAAVRENTVFNNLCKGVEMTLKHFEQTLEQVGVKPISAQGQAFDPTKHEAMGEAQNSEVPEGHVASEMQAGFMLHDRVLRPARVLVNKIAEKLVNKAASDAAKGE